MRRNHARRVSKVSPRRTATALLALAGPLILLFVVDWWSLALREEGSQRKSRITPNSALPTPRFPQLTDRQLQTAADEFLAAVDPEQPDNVYFSDFAKQALQWMVREHKAGRLDVLFFKDTLTSQLPPDVLMAAWPQANKATIFISKPMFAKFLAEGNAAAPPFTQQQKNDFALALIHELVHLQNPAANPRDPEARALEESRAWRDVTLRVVRDLMAANQPIDQRFRDVDQALRSCHDQLPCPVLARLVRLGL